MTLRNTFRVAACLALLGLSACPSACERGCNQMDFCADKLNGDHIDVAECIDQCGKVDCVNTAEIYDCYATMRCANGLSYAGELLSCAALCDSK